MKSQNFNFSRGQESHSVFGVFFASVMYKFKISESSTKTRKLIVPSERTHLDWVRKKITFVIWVEYIVSK